MSPLSPLQQAPRVPSRARRRRILIRRATALAVLLAVTAAAVIIVRGAWASYVLHEVIPRALAVTHADPRRIAIAGISMGGFGALSLARVEPGRFCAVGGHSAALWARGADSAAGAFDDAQDFARHDLLRAARRSDIYGRTPIWLDVGASDPFHAADAQLAAELRRRGARVQFTTSPGGHDVSYWDAHWGAYLRFYARSLAACR
jgi:S-formylglutathione hydrolase FrmB